MGTADYNNVYPVTPIDADRFALDAPWVLGSALGVRRLASRKRRGVGLSGSGQRVDVSGAPLQVWFCERGPGVTWGPYSTDGFERRDKLPKLTAQARFGRLPGRRAATGA